MVELQSRHKDMIRREIAGATVDELTTEFGLSKAAISTIRHSALYKGELDKLSKELDEKIVETVAERIASTKVIEIFNESADELAKALVDIALNSDSDKTRQTAISDIMNRLGYKLQPKDEGASDINIMINEEAMKALVSASKERK